MVMIYNEVTVKRKIGRTEIGLGHFWWYLPYREYDIYVRERQKNKKDILFWLLAV